MWLLKKKKTRKHKNEAFGALWPSDLQNRTFQATFLDARCTQQCSPLKPHDQCHQWKPGFCCSYTCTLKWAAPQGLPQSTGLWRFRWRAKQQSGGFHARLVHVSLTHTSDSLAFALCCIFTVCNATPHPPPPPSSERAHTWRELNITSELRTDADPDHMMHFNDSSWMQRVLLLNKRVKR